MQSTGAGGRQITLEDERSRAGHTSPVSGACNQRRMDDQGTFARVNEADAQRTR